MGAYIGSLLLVPFNFAPHGWALCNGQLLPINQNQALFSLIGNKFGGNGKTDFALPNLSGPKSIIDASGASCTWVIALQGMFPTRA
jgi:microcystin-dependent protein